MTKHTLTTQYGTILLLIFLFFFSCGRKVVRPPLAPSVSQQKPAQDSSQKERFIPIPIVDDGVVNGPGKETTYAPTVYADLPVKRVRPGNAIPAPSNGCNFVGEVWDFAGEGDCSQVIETTNGYLLSITGLPQGYYLEGGSRIRFGFNYDNIHDDPCSLTDGSIRITCLQLLRSASGFPRPIVCEVHDKPSQWIHELIQDLSATYVTRFPWDNDRVVYLFETPSGQYLYDCRGFILCQPKTNCLQFIKDFSLGTQIYEG